MLDAELDTDGLAERITDNVDAARMAAHTQMDAGATGFVCASDTMAMGVLRAFDERSILDDAALAERFAEEIPVLLIDGEVHNYWRIDPVRLKTALLAG